MSKKFDVFISYAHADSGPAKALATALKNQGASVFMDSAELNAGEDWATRTESTLAKSNAAVFLVSDASRRSQWVNYEMGVALGTSGDEGVRIIPVLLHEAEPSALPGPMRGRALLRLDDSRTSVDKIAEQVVLAVGRSGKAEG